MKVNITLSGQLEIEDDDLKRFQDKGPDELLHALMLNNSRIDKRVSEVYEKPAKAGKING